jgi:hypothetical protein
VEGGNAVGIGTSKSPVEWQGLMHLRLRSRLASGKSRGAVTPGSDFPSFGEGNHRQIAQERLWNHSSNYLWPGQPADDKLDVEVVRLEIEITPR